MIIKKNNDEYNELIKIYEEHKNKKRKLSVFLN